MQGHIWREVGVGGREEAWMETGCLCLLPQWQNNREWQEHISNLGYAQTLFSYPNHKTLSVRDRRVEPSKMWITNLC